MKNKYILKYLIIIGLMILTLIAYFCFDYEEIKNLLGNIFAGLITGLIIAILTNIKNKYIFENTKEIEMYKDILNKSKIIIKEQVNLQNKEEIPILELINLFADIHNELEECYNIVCNSKNELFKLEKFNWKEISKMCTDKIGELSDEVHEINISFAKYKEDYQKDLSSLIVYLHKFNLIIAKRLKDVINDTESLNKSII